MKWCWHRWNVFKERRRSCNAVWDILKTTKVCRKCGETRIKEKMV